MTRLNRPILPLTREGVIWFTISLALLVTGLFKGINLITLLASWMVTLVLFNYWWAKPQLRDVTVRRYFSEAAFAGTPFTILLQVQNNGHKPAYGIIIRDAALEGPITRFLARIDAGACVAITQDRIVPRRGIYQMPPLTLASGYPLALVRLTKEMSASDRLVVFPQLGSLRTGTLRRFLSHNSPTLGQARAFPRRHPGAQTEFHGLRPLRPGDSPRWIHWRTTARRGELMVREFEDTPSDHLVLIVATGPREGPALERLLSLAATICWEWCRQKNNRLALVLAGSQPTVHVGNTGPEFAYEALEQLACARTSPNTNYDTLLNMLTNTELPPGPILLVSATSSDLASAIAQALHRPPAHINLAAGEDAAFFEDQHVEMQNSLATDQHGPNTGKKC